MATLPKWRGKLLALPRYEDDPAAVDDHSGLPPLLPGDSYTVVFQPAPELLKRPPGRPRLPAAEVAQREAAKKPPGRPSRDPGKQTLRECLWRIAEAARAAGIDPAGIINPSCPEQRQLQKAKPFPDYDKTTVPEIRYAADPPAAWRRLPWRERKAAIWERARAA